jgi:hypothetical protein
VRKGGTRVRFTREGHELLGELLLTLPRFDLRKRDGLCLGVRKGAEFIGAHGASATMTARSDCSFAILSAVLPSDQPPQLKPTKIVATGTDGCALQQTLQRFSSKD